MRKNYGDPWTREGTYNNSLYKGDDWVVKDFDGGNAVAVSSGDDIVWAIDDQEELFYLEGQLQTAQKKIEFYICTDKQISSLRNGTLMPLIPSDLSLLVSTCEQ